MAKYRNITEKIYVRSYAFHRGLDKGRIGMLAWCDAKDTYEKWGYGHVWQAAEYSWRCAHADDRTDAQLLIDQYKHLKKMLKVYQAQYWSWPLKYRGDDYLAAYHTLHNTAQQLRRLRKHIGWFCILPRTPAPILQDR